MKDRIAAILQLLLLPVRHIFIARIEREYSPTRKSETHQNKRSQCDPLAKCYYCKGTGIVQDSIEFNAFNPTRCGTLDSISGNPLATCPICNGTGHISH